MFAASAGREPVVEALLHAGANARVRDVDEATAADLARQAGHAALAVRLDAAR
jgi:ankyrin repeat protein